MPFLKCVSYSNTFSQTPAPALAKREGPQGSEEFSWGARHLDSSLDLPAFYKLMDGLPSSAKHPPNPPARESRKSLPIIMCNFTAREISERSLKDLGF